MAVRLTRVTLGALPFAAALLTLQVHGAAQQSQMRYAEMDANRDGVITFSEWRGTRAAFNAADWNRDGVLSGNEVWTQTERNTTRQPGDFDLSVNNDDQADDSAQRFEYLDANRNGWIERREWRGTYAAFNALDRNGDNLLSRTEMGVRRGAVGTSGTVIRGRFEEMDANDDGIINAREWFGTRAGFNAVDTNRDGVISRREYRVSQNGVEPQSGTAVRRDALNQQFVRLDSRQQWMATGVYVDVGDIITFDTEGSATLSDNTSDVAGPDGSRTGRKADNSPMRDQPAGAVIGRIGNSAPFLVGSTKVMRAQNSGQLFLGTNDDFTQDNNGVYRVRVSIR